MTSAEAWKTILWDVWRTFGFCAPWLAGLWWGWYQNQSIQEGFEDLGLFAFSLIALGWQIYWVAT